MADTSDYMNYLSGVSNFDEIKNSKEQIKQQKIALDNTKKQEESSSIFPVEGLVATKLLTSDSTKALGKNIGKKIFKTGDEDADGLFSDIIDGNIKNPVDIADRIGTKILQRGIKKVGTIRRNLNRIKGEPDEEGQELQDFTGREPDEMETNLDEASRHQDDEEERNQHEEEENQNENEVQETNLDDEAHAQSQTENVGNETENVGENVGENVAEDAGEIGGEEAGEIGGEVAGEAVADGIAGALDATGIGAIVGIPLMLGGLIASFATVFKHHSHHVSLQGVAHPDLQAGV
jgi:hypothetical protein